MSGTIAHLLRWLAYQLGDRPAPTGRPARLSHYGGSPARVVPLRRPQRREPA